MERGRAGAPRCKVEEYFHYADMVPPGPPWLVGVSYDREGLDRESYELWKENPGLHRAFAQLLLDKGAILEFANRWGRLTLSGQVLLRVEKGGVPQRFRAESLRFWKFAIQEMRDALLLWDLLGGPTGVPDEQGLRQVIVWENGSVSFRPAGEKLWFLYKQRARRSRETLEAMQKGDSQMAEAAERQFRHSGEQILKYLEQSQRAFLGIKPIGTVDSDQAFAVWKARRDVVGPARWLLSRFITQHLEGKVDLVIEPKRGGWGFSTALEPRDLLSAMWLQLFFEVTGRTKLRQCPICGTFFDVTSSPRRIYCDSRGSGCRQKAARMRKKLIQLIDAGIGIEKAAAELGMDAEKAEFLLRTTRGRS